jgi:hypothetical protein
MCHGPDPGAAGLFKGRDAEVAQLLSRAVLLRAAGRAAAARLFHRSMPAWSVRSGARSAAIRPTSGKPQNRGMRYRLARNGAAKRLGDMPFDHSTKGSSILVRFMYAG